MTRIPLFLLPGMLCDASYWRPQIEGLSDIAECHVVDFETLDSFGAMADKVLRLAPREFAIAGHSMGGRVVFEVLRRAPNRILCSGLFGTAYAGPLPSERGEKETALRAAQIKRAQDEGMRAFGEQWVQRMVHPDRLGDRRLIETILTMVAGKSVAVLEAQIHASLHRDDFTTDLSGIACPTLLLCGRQDAARPLGPHEAMHAAIADSRLEIIENCGHMSTIEQPAAVTAAMRKWLLRATIS